MEKGEDLHKFQIWGGREQIFKGKKFLLSKRHTQERKKEYETVGDGVGWGVECSKGYEEAMRIEN